ncbi:unnamed protein product [Moneuplotes crassus]|uniref:Uncharacterized protein n=1 Tax=Euplotes crassus TaxID=5936 RepID=A0AAD1Y0F7_EUPCR|nr:unnamed protein product [Moneuplotes crassus]
MQSVGNIEKYGTDDLDSISEFNSSFEQLSTVSAAREKEEYLKHLKKLRYAIKIELKNEKMMSVNIVDEIFKKRLDDYTDAVNCELQHIHKYVDRLQRTITLQEVKFKQLAEIFRKFELDKTIKALQTREFGPKYLKEPESVVKKDKSYTELRDLIETNLRFVKSGTSCFDHKSIQVTDYENINKIKNLEIENKLLDTKLDEIHAKETNESRFLRESVESDFQKTKETFFQREDEYLTEINQLKNDKEKLIQEMSQVKMILKSPFLYMKYYNARFGYFPKLDICRPKSPAKHRNNGQALNYDKAVKRKMRRSSTSCFPNPVYSAVNLHPADAKKSDQKQAQKPSSSRRKRVSKDDFNYDKDFENKSSYLNLDIQTHESSSQEKKSKFCIFDKVFNKNTMKLNMKAEESEYMNSFSYKPLKSTNSQPIKSMVEKSSSQQENRELEISAKKLPSFKLPHKKTDEYGEGTVTSSKNDKSVTINSSVKSFCKENFRKLIQTKSRNPEFTSKLKLEIVATAGTTSKIVLKSNTSTTRQRSRKNKSRPRKYFKAKDNVACRSFIGGISTKSYAK